MEYFAYLIGLLIGMIIKFYKFLFKSIFQITRVPAINAAKWIAKKIKQTEKEEA